MVLVRELLEKINSDTININEISEDVLNNTCGDENLNLNDLAEPRHTKQNGVNEYIFEYKYPKNEHGHIPIRTFIIRDKPFSIGLLYRTDNCPNMGTIINKDGKRTIL